MFLCQFYIMQTSEKYSQAQTARPSTIHAVSHAYCTLNGKISRNGKLQSDWLALRYFQSQSAKDFNSVKEK